MRRAKCNFRRARIEEEGYLSVIEIVPDSERNKRIVMEYVSGKSYAELAQEYGVSVSRICGIIAAYIRHAQSLVKERN